jgi:hypothetical protein
MLSLLWCGVAHAAGFLDGRFLVLASQVLLGKGLCWLLMFVWAASGSVEPGV